MNQRRESWLLAGVQALVLAACLAGIVWDWAVGLIFNIDGLLLLLICLSLAAVFSLTLFLQARSEAWLQKLRSPKSAESPAEETAVASAGKESSSGNSK